MGDLVNLRRARKAKAKSAADKKAEENRVRFGLTLVERKLTKAGAVIEKIRFEGHRLSQAMGMDKKPDPVSGNDE